MKRMILGAMVAVTVTFTSAAADISVLENDQDITVDCEKDKHVSITGNNVKITFTGTCESLQVLGNEARVSGSVKKANIAGNDNLLTFDAIDAISVLGNNNKVAWKKAVNPKKKKPAVKNVGNKNVIAKSQ